MGGHLLAPFEVDDFGHILHDVQHPLVVFLLQARLGVVAELDGLTNYDAAAVRPLAFGHDVEQGRFADAVWADDAYLLAPLEDIGEVVEQTTSVVMLGYVVELQYLASDALGLHREFGLLFVETGAGFGLQIVEGVDAGFRLGSTSLRHPSHPLELGAVEAAGLLHFGLLYGLSLGFLLDIIGEIATIAVELAVVEFDDVVADVVDEVAVVAHEQYGETLLGEEFLQPLDHRDVEVVGGFVEDEKVRVVEQYSRERHLLLLAAAHLIERFVEVGYLEAAEHLLDPLLESPGLLVLVRMGRIDVLSYCESPVGDGVLRKVSHAGAGGEDNTTVVGQHAACEYVEQRRLAISVAGNESRLLSGVDSKGDVVEQHLVAERLGEIFNRKQSVRHVMCYFVIVLSC